MANNKLVFEGLFELRDALRQLPAALTAEASAIVVDAANGAKADIVNDYPARTGELKSKVSVTVQAAGTLAVVAIVKNTSPLANIFENGTQARHTSLGANRGSMPPGHVFIPNVARRRRQMYEKLKELLRSQGLVVSGDA